MRFAYDERTEEPRARLLAFMDSHVHPAEPVYAAQAAERDHPWAPPVVAEPAAAAREAGCGTSSCPARTARA